MRKSDALTLAVSLSIGLLILEIGLQFFTPYPIRSPSNSISHEWLGRVMNPAMDEIDEMGFRNKPMSSIDVIAIGDSHTYGFNVSSENSWPKMMGKGLGMNVYNFGIGGYGLLQYHYLMDKAIEMNPKEIILGLFSRNDLDNVCQHANNIPLWESRGEELGLDVSLCPEKEKAKKIKGGVSFWLRKSSAIVSMLAEFNTNRKIWMRLHLTGAYDGVVVNDDHIKSLINMKKVKAQGQHMDMTEPGIKMAFEVLRVFLEKSSQKLKSRGIGFSVLLIPSKEMVFNRYLTENNYILPDEYRSLVTDENYLRKMIIQLLEEKNIHYGSVLPDLQQALMNDGDVYPANADDHPQLRGYKVYAEVAEKIIRESGSYAD